MKKALLLFAVLTLAVPLVSSGQEKKEPETAIFLESNYYPLKEGAAWHYQVTQAKGEKQKVTVQVEKREILQFKKKKEKDKEESKRVVCFMLRVTSGDKTLTEHVGILEDGVYRFTSAGKEITPPLRFMKLGLEKGETWECESVSESAVLKGVFSSDMETVRVPAGQFNAMVVTAKDFQIGQQKMNLTYWFANKVGIVKQRTSVGDLDILLELEKYEPAK
ncbi:MAG: hypothetical protein L0215_05105 [Gemmataceae bacterium]|nr:hypothetical protein [Gemmataceae bacterium]